MASLRKSLAIDLGTSSVLVIVKGQGLVCEEPSVIVKDVLTNKILSVGSKAEEILGRAPGNVQAIRPLKDGVIVDFDATEEMLRYFLKRSVKKSLLSPDCLICVPSKSSQVEKRAVIQAGGNAGFHRISLIEEPLAAALGAGVDIADVGGNMVVDIGGGTTELAVISLGRVVVSDSLDIAGNTFTEDIKTYIGRRYGLLLGEKSCQDIKEEASAKGLEEAIEVVGREISTGLPTSILLPVEEVYATIKPSIDKIVEKIEDLMEKTPPELVADIYDRGIVLTGGGALTLGLASRINEKFQLPVTISNSPVQCVVEGCEKALDILDQIDRDSTAQVKLKKEQLENKEKLRRR